MKTVLIIDDEKSWGEDIVLQLNKFGFNTLLAATGYEGIGFAQKYSPAIIFCDISLPDIDGFEVHSKLQKSNPAINAPFIFISGIADLPSINKRIKSLHCDHLTKPFRLKKIIDVIEKKTGSDEIKKDNVILLSNDEEYKNDFQKSISSLNYNLFFSDNITSLCGLLKKGNNKFVILDLSISETSCFEAISILDEMNLIQHLHVLILGDKFDSKLFNKFMTEGISDYIIKSGNFDEVINSLRIRSNREKIQKKADKNNVIKLLIVEDDSDFSMNLEYQLKKTGIQSYFANCGAQAVELAKTINPDLILCDINLPDFDGIKVFTDLKELISKSQIPFIFQSGKGEWKDFRKALNTGAEGLLIKPYKFKDLLNVINNFFELKKEEKKEETQKLPLENTVTKKNISGKMNNQLSQDHIVISTNLFDNVELRIPHLDIENNLPEVNSDKESNKLNDSIKKGKEINEVWTDTKRIIKKKCTLDYNLEYFLNNRDDSKDYSKFIYNDIAIIKLNIRRAVLKEAQQFYKFIFDIILEGYNKFIIDLNEVEFIDSTFVGVLVSALKRISFNRGVLKLVCNPERSTSNFVLFTGMQNIFDISYDMREVIDDFQQNIVN